jgi:hypothetical protein
MTEHERLCVEVWKHDITATKRGTPFAVTFRKDPESPMLVAREVLRSREIKPLFSFCSQAPYPLDTDVLHPIDDFPHQGFLNGNVRHG